MALWDGSTLNKTDVASMFNQLWAMGSVAIVRKDNGLLYAITDKNWEQNVPTKGAKFQGMTKASGNKIELRLLGKLEDPQTVADGAAELATANPLYSDDAYGAATFDLTHFADSWGVLSSQWKRIRGQEAKTKSFIKDKAMEIMLAYENKWGNMINGTHADGNTRTKLGSWVHAFSDGVSTGETAYASYGTINRTDAANADFRGVVGVNTGTLTLAKIGAHRNRIKPNGGKTDLLVAETTIYSSIEEKLQNYAQVNYDEKWAKFGSECWTYARMVGIQDHRAPTGVLGFFDSSTCAWWQDTEGVFDADTVLTRDPSRRAARVIPVEAWVAFLCKKPSANGKLTGITG